jgi:polyisoprenoid-binding protein YceI
VWTFDGGSGSLQVLTGVDGTAARMGHRLTIGVPTWQAELTWEGDQPSALTLTADVAALVVESGEGGMTPLTAPERLVARSNALKTLSTKQFPRVTFESRAIDPTDTGYRLTGTLEIHGVRRDHTVDVAVVDEQISARTEVRQSDFDIKPFSMMMGGLRVADAVTVVFSASAADSHHAG